MGERKVAALSVALERAKVFLGPRVRVYKEDGLCVIARAEMTQEGTRYRRIYGCGGSGCPRPSPLPLNPTPTCVGTLRGRPDETHDR